MTNSKQSTACECPLSPDGQPKWCTRHRCTKTLRLIELCQTREDYFQHFERGDSPQQYAERWKHLRGLGDLLEAVLSATGVRRLWHALRKLLGFDKPCNCAKRRELLNWSVPFGGERK